MGFNRHGRRIEKNAPARTFGNGPGDSGELIAVSTDLHARRFPLRLIFVAAVHKKQRGIGRDEEGAVAAGKTNKILYVLEVQDQNSFPAAGAEEASQTAQPPIRQGTIRFHGSASVRCCSATAAILQ